MNIEKKGKAMKNYRKDYYGYGRGWGFFSPLGRLIECLSVYGVDKVPPTQALFPAKCPVCGRFVALYLANHMDKEEQHWIFEHHTFYLGGGKSCPHTHYPAFRFVNKLGERKLYEPFETTASA